MWGWGHRDVGHHLSSGPEVTLRAHSPLRSGLHLLSIRPFPCPYVQVPLVLQDPELHPRSPWLLDTFFNSFLVSRSECFRSLFLKLCDLEKVLISRFLIHRNSGTFSSFYRYNFMILWLDFEGRRSHFICARLATANKLLSPYTAFQLRNLFSQTTSPSHCSCPGAAAKFNVHFHF